MVVTIWRGMISRMANNVARSGGPVARQFWRSVLRIGAILAFFRVLILWYLVYREWTGTQSISVLPLILLLFPEGAVVPHGLPWTAAHAWLFSGLLTIGSFTAAFLIRGLNSLDRNSKVTNPQR